MVLPFCNKVEEYFPYLLKQAFCEHKWLLMIHKYNSLHAHQNAPISLLPLFFSVTRDIANATAV